MDETTKYLISVVGGTGGATIFFGLFRYLIIRYLKNIDERLGKISLLISAINKMKADIKIIKLEIENIKKDL